MTKLVLPLMLLLAALATAQTTYTVTSPVSGVSTTPFRAFNIPLSGSGNQVNWLEVGPNTSCAGQTLPAVGFIFLTIDGVALPCAPLTDSPSRVHGTFVGGSYDFVITTVYRCSGGRGGGGCHTVFTIQSGDVVLN